MPAQTVIQIRRDTAANWESVDPTLAAGEIGFDTTNNQIKIGNGTDEWTVLEYASGGGGASVQVSDTAPADPEVGNVWYNSAEGTSYIYYDSYWVPLTPAIVGPEGPQGPAGPSGVISVTAPITNSGTSTEAVLGLDQSALAINMSQVATDVSDKSASYTLVAGDANSFIRSTGSAITITVPDVLANGESVNFIQAGAEQITFAGSGVTINSKDAKLKTNAQFSGATITKLGGAYYLVGDLGE